MNKAFTFIAAALVLMCAAQTTNLQQEALNQIAANIGSGCTAPTISSCTADRWCEESGNCGWDYKIKTNSEGNVVYLFGIPFRMIDLQHGK